MTDYVSRIAQLLSGPPPASAPPIFPQDMVARLMSETIVPKEPGREETLRALLGDRSTLNNLITPIGQDASMSPANMAMGLLGGPSLRGVRLGLPASQPGNTNIPVGQRDVSNIVPPPLSLSERTWQNYGRRMSPDDVLQAEPIWGGAQEIAERTGVPLHQAFSQLANDMWQRMGANRYMSPDLARRYMSGEKAKMMGIHQVP